MMTRKDFQELADMVRLELDDVTPHTRALIAVRLASVCKRANPAFKRDVFYRACGLEEMADN